MLTTAGTVQFKPFSFTAPLHRLRALAMPLVPCNGLFESKVGVECTMERWNSSANLYCLSTLISTDYTIHQGPFFVLHHLTPCIIVVQAGSSICLARKWPLSLLLSIVLMIKYNYISSSNGALYP
jgi:hypothetical protein